MSIKLFEHNQSAYESVLEMLSDEGKAAVVHPTGTGKSYIGFKLCEQFPEKIICWLSPSEYIFNTQLENLKQDSDGWQPENIAFFTYAKLMLMTDSELADIKPDYIVLDEFHRCGAEMWGDGVDRLLSMYPDTPILGLSATAIRYLDNQRNMADELFNGNIASEMTLGEAIVRGILNPPKYVMSVFAYQEDYNRLKRRVRSAKSKAVRDSAERYLEALRRALEMADGLDKVFDKHMENRTGKYIVFCSNIEHLREMQSKAKEWFGKIDSEPHIYTAYSEDPTTSKEFQNFKQDNSDHLKLLYAIDMLNEGIHVDDVSGVILFRPTLSPIIYKQQIGRALAAGKNNVPVIFDIVNNIENLYSIGTIQQEMQVAISYYRSHGMDSYIVNDRFEVIDEVREAKQLFDTLNDTLSASWDVMFSYAEQYYLTNGNLEVPRRYKTDDGYSLGNWIFTQRKVYAGESYGCLDEQRIKKLENIGMVWNSTRDLSWERNFNAAQTYFESNGNLYVPVDYVTDDGIKLGVWLSNLRTYRKNDNHKAMLTHERIKKLEAIGMIWDVPDYLWQQNYNALLDYYRSHGNIDVPKGYITEDGIKLYQWLLNVKQAYRRTNRKGYRLTNSQIQQLEELGVDWRTRSEIAFEAGLSHAKDYFSENRNLDVPVSYKSPDGYKLGGWISDQKEKFAAGKLTQDKIEALEQVGMVWEKPDPWEERFELAEKYYREHGDLEIPPSYTVDGIWISKWLDEQRQIRNGKRKGKSLTDEQIKRLDEIGMRWCKKEELQWDEQFADVRAYRQNYGNINIPQSYLSPNGRRSGLWLQRQRKKLRDGKLSVKQEQLLKAVGV